MSATTTSNLSDDLLEGAKAIAAFMGNKWTAKRVYRLADMGGWPIWHEPGVGLMARKSALLRHLQERENEATSKANAA
jgi:hypothetical protein